MAQLSIIIIILLKLYYCHETVSCTFDVILKVCHGVFWENYFALQKRVFFNTFESIPFHRTTTCMYTFFTIWAQSLQNRLHWAWNFWWRSTFALQFREHRNQLDTTTYPQCRRQDADKSFPYLGGIDTRHQADKFRGVGETWNFHAERPPPPWDIHSVYNLQ
jgi:hypothetical protein